MSTITTFASNALTHVAILTASKAPGGGEVVAFELGTLIRIGIAAVWILVLFYIISRILFKPIREALRKRKEGIEKDFKDIETGKEEVAKLKETYEYKLANIEAEADQILGAAHKKAIEQQKELIAEAKDEAERIMNRAKVEINREQDKARDAIKQEAVQIASLIASKFIASTMDATTQDKLLNEAINEIGDSVWKD